jgi:hypothetical protein
MASALGVREELKSAGRTHLIKITWPEESLSCVFAGTTLRGVVPPEITESIMQNNSGAEGAKGVCTGAHVIIMQECGLECMEKRERRRTSLLAHVLVGHGNIRSLRPVDTC